MDMKRFFLYAIVIATLALAGCGGNGGGTDTAMPMPDPTPDPTPTACPEGQVGTPPNCMDPTPTELTAHEMAFVRGIVNPSVADDPTTSRATNHVSRPGQSAGERLNVTPGGMAATTANAATNQYIPPAHKPVTQIGTQNIDAADSPFKKMGSEGTLGSFMMQTYEKQTRGLTDTVTLFTNRDDPKAVDYTMYYGGADGATDQSRPAVTGSVTAATGVLDIDETAATIATYGDLFQSSRFPTANKREVTYGDSGTPEDIDSDRTLTGSFNGVEGTFKCEGATCSAMANANGDLIDLVGTWTFTPKGDLKTLKVPDANYDSDYLTFGYWISETTTASGSRFEVGTLYDGSQPITANVTTLTGTATYVGEAAGAYARKGDNPKVGEFTGHASLTANFGAADALGTIKGTISQLVDGGEAIDPSWTVELQTANIEQATAGTDPATFDGATPRGGNWRGGFFGATGDGATDYPRGVAGDFTGHFDNGHVIGAFGATRR